MTTIETDLKLNQNLWLLLISFVSLGASEYFCFEYLLIFSMIITILATLSLCFTVTFYTYHYCRKKLAK